MRIWPLLIVSLLSVAANTGESALTWDGCTVPIAVQVTQDVPMGRGNCGAYVRGTLCATNVTDRTITDDVIIKKGQQVRVLDYLGEGGCELEFAGARYSLGSCPWHPGFSDKQSDIFIVVKLPSPVEAKDACLKFRGGAG
jgi:hypothetical protein